jgi:hypothetical protein
MEAKTRTAQILIVMKIVAWIAFIGFSIEAGSIFISYLVSLGNPEGARNIYNGINLLSLQQYDFSYYSAMVSYLFAIAAMKSTIWCMVIGVLSKINLSNPFTMEVALKLQGISYILLGTAIVSVLHNSSGKWLSKHTGDFYGTATTEEYLFMAGLVFIISQIYKRGVELQSENELTV